MDMSLLGHSTNFNLITRYTALCCSLYAADENLNKFFLFLRVIQYYVLNTVVKNQAPLSLFVCMCVSFTFRNGIARFVWHLHWDARIENTNEKLLWCAGWCEYLPLQIMQKTSFTHTQKQSEMSGKIYMITSDDDECIGHFEFGLTFIFTPIQIVFGEFLLLEK